MYKVLPNVLQGRDDHNNSPLEQYTLEDLKQQCNPHNRCQYKSKLKRNLQCPLDIHQDNNLHNQVQVPFRGLNGSHQCKLHKLQCSRHNHPHNRCNLHQL